MRIYFYLLCLLTMTSCADEDSGVSILKTGKNKLYFKEYFVNQKNEKDTLVSLKMSLDSTMFYYKIGDDIPLHFSIKRERDGNMIMCDVVYEWDESSKVVRVEKGVNKLQVGNLSHIPTGGLKIHRGASFLLVDGKLSVITNDLTEESSGMIYGLGKKLKEFTGKDMIYSAFIVDSDSVYVKTHDRF